MARLHPPAIAVACGDGHVLALHEDGSVSAWGSNEFGQLGDGSRVDRAVPAPVPGLAGVTAVAAGSHHSLALLGDGSVVAWGCTRANLGDGTPDDLVPVPVAGLDGGVATIAAGGASSFALMSDGRVLAWGFNASGNLGDGTTASRQEPVPVAALEGRARVIGAGLAVDQDGKLLVWGYNGVGQLGIGSREPRLIPTAVDTPGPVREATNGGAHRLAVQVDGSASAWGLNRSGQLGTGATADSTIPVAVQGLPGPVVAVAAGHSHSLALGSDGTVLAWGRNAFDQIGDGSGLNQCLPVRLEALDDVQAIAAAKELSVALRGDGSVVSWGRGLPHPEPPDLPVGATKLGGRPDLPLGAEWPTSPSVAPQSFVAQIDLAEVAALDGGGALPSAGLLSFFYDAAAWPSGGAPSDAGGWTVLLTEPGTPLVRLDFPRSLGSKGRFAPVPLRPQGGLTLPPAALVDDLLPGFTGKESDAYQRLVLDLAEHPVHRMLGFEDPVQTSRVQTLECELVAAGHDLNTGYPAGGASLTEAAARAWRLLLQVDSESAAGTGWGDAGRLYFWIRADDLAARRFDRVWLIFQSH